MNAPTSILAAINFGQETDTVVHAAAGIAARLNAGLRLLHVDTLPSPHTEPHAPTPDDCMQSAGLNACDANVHVETIHVSGQCLQTIRERLVADELLVMGAGTGAVDIDSMHDTPASAIWELCQPVLVVFLRDNQEAVECVVPDGVCNCQQERAAAIAATLDLPLRTLTGRPASASRRLPCECFYG